VSKGSRKRKPARRAAVITPAARREPPSTPPRPSPGRLPDELLPPWERGPVRAFVRDAVDARGARLTLLFMPAFALALITIFGPASQLGHYLKLASLAALAVVAVDTVLLGSSITRAARRAFPTERINRIATTWYVFMRAHRPRSMRRPAPTVSRS
jgi:Protein of unknown function (DUF3043)